MNKAYLKRYKITIETIGPLFIGSGHEIGKKDWIFDRKANTAHIIDENKLFVYLRRKNLLKSFEKYMLYNGKGLYEWARENNAFNDIIKQAAKYSLDCDAIAEVNTMKGIKTFIKDGYGRPYIPGSSIKGAIRNILLSKYIENDTNAMTRGLYQALTDSGVRNQEKIIDKEFKAVDSKYFRTLNRENTKSDDAVNDIMSGLRISDSKPLEYSNLTLCQKIDAKLNGDTSDMPIFRECIKPETKVELNLTIDSTVFKHGISYIEGAIEQFLTNYNEEFLAKFREEKVYNGNIIYLGGGAGYHTKTAISALLKNDAKKVKIIGNIINNTVARKKRDEHRHYDDYKLGVSPHIVKLTEYDGELLQMGPCYIDFSEV